MIPRFMMKTLEHLATQYPVITVLGPRQSGKTTLVRAAFPDHEYVSLEEPDRRDFAHTDPRHFLSIYGKRVILDEVQRVPELLSYIQTLVDIDGAPGRFILTGSSNLLLLEKVTQTLAGRVALMTLLPFSLSELSQAGMAEDDIDELLFKGFYPRIYDRNLEPRQWYANYVTTFLERDVRNVLKIADLERFQLFLRMCAARSGQLLNLSAIGNDCGITHNTARSWMSVLEAIYIIYPLKPHFINFNKRLVKAAKLYFLDPGLLCYLLEIDSPRDLRIHANRGAIFETWVVSDLLKSCLNLGFPPRLYFWRDYTGHEVDVVAGSHPKLTPIEIKSGSTVTKDFFRGLDYWRGLSGVSPEECWLIYGGNQDQKRSHGTVVGWKSIGTLADHLNRRGEFVGHKNTNSATIFGDDICC
jgi:predicted AAA+ superfamily ATPase